MAANGLLDELKSLRKGRGVNAAMVSDHVGPSLRELCGITAEDSAEAVRWKLVTRLDALVQNLPADLALAARAALGLHESVQKPFLAERVDWLAGELGRDARTARRRIDDALGRLAQVATPTGGASMEGRGMGDWYLEELHALLRLDQAAPEAIERRVVVAERDGLDRIEVLIALPRDPAIRAGPHDLFVDVLYGATLVSKHHDMDCRFRITLELSRSLRAGDRHESSLLFRVPSDLWLLPHYVFTSPRRCDLFDLRIRFGAGRVPQRIWQVADAFHREVDNPMSTAEMLEVDRAGESRVQFRNLRPGFGYGARWTDHPTYELSTVPGLPRW